MFHVGLDIHSKHITICVLGETGQVFRRCRVRGLEEMLGVLRGLPDRFEVCYEASCGYGHYHDLLRPIAVRVNGYARRARGPFSRHPLPRRTGKSSARCNGREGSPCG